jgi:hypothetical protein
MTTFGDFSLKVGGQAAPTIVFTGYFVDGYAEVGYVL